MKLGTSTECLLGTLEPSATLPLLETPFLNLYLELSLGTSELGTSWNFETFQNLSLEALVAWNLHLKPDLEPLLGPLSWNLATFQNQTVLGTLEPSKPVLGTRVFVDLLDPSLATWNLETLPGTLILKTFETPGAFIWNPYLEPWNLPKLYLRTFAGNLDRHLEPSRTYTLTWMEPIYTWNLGIFRNLYLEPLLGTSEPSGTLYDWNPYLEPRNLPEPLLGTLKLGTSEPAGTFTWNPYLEPRNLPEPLLGTLTWNLGTCRNLYLEPLYLEPRNLRNLTWNLGTCRNLYLEPLLGTSEPAGTFTWNPCLEPRSPPEPLLGILTWNLGTCRNLYLEPLLGTSEPARTWRDDCPRVPQGLVWLGPQSFQLLGKNFHNKNKMNQKKRKPS